MLLFHILPCLEAFACYFIWVGSVESQGVVRITLAFITFLWIIKKSWLTVGRIFKWFKGLKAIFCFLSPLVTLYLGNHSRDTIYAVISTCVPKSKPFLDIGISFLKTTKLLDVVRKLMESGYVWGIYFGVFFIQQISVVLHKHVNFYPDQGLLKEIPSPTKTASIRKFIFYMYSMVEFVMWMSFAIHIKSCVQATLVTQIMVAYSKQDSIMQIMSEFQPGFPFHRKITKIDSSEMVCGFIGMVLIFILVQMYKKNPLSSEVSK